MEGVRQALVFFALQALPRESFRLFIGPVFTRELVTAPRRPKHYVARVTYVGGLVMLIVTAWLVLTGTQKIRNIGDLARFGTILFQILAPLQLALAIFFSALFTASSVSHEKDRRTLILLLLTDLSNFEIVLGKLMASLLNVFVLVLAALPLFVGLTLLGGVSLRQVLEVFAVTVFTVLVAGSLGSTVALWREKTFQALALTVLALVFWLGLWEVVALMAPPRAVDGVAWRNVATACSPWRAVLEATRPDVVSAGGSVQGWQVENLFLPVAMLAAVLLNAVAVWRVRVWNTSPERRRERMPVQQASETIFSHDVAVQPAGAAEVEAAAPPRVKKPSRQVWDAPVLWREIRTWAYGRKILAIRVAYLILAAFAFVGVGVPVDQGGADATTIAVPLFLISLVLINAQAVTSLSTERDGKTLDLLLVTDLSPGDFIFGKLGGVLYNTKEMILVPAALCVYLCGRGQISLENVLYLIVGLLVMNVFVAVLGIHCGLVHTNTRVAIGTSLGTVFFLFVGIATCMRIMVAFSGSFGYQLAPFLAFMLGGGIGMYVSLGARNASTAIMCAAFACPFLTFWAITSFLQGQTLGPFVATIGTYLFTTAAMLIPALAEFDLAAGRTTE